MMKRFLILVFVLQVVFQSANAMHAAVNVYQFQTDNKSYVEVFFYILGSSVESGVELAPSVQIQYMVLDSGKVAAGDKYNLVTNTAEDGDFMDLRRHFLAPGKYTVVVEVKDNNNPKDIVRFTKAVVIEEVDEVASFSDMQLLSIASKSGDKADKWSKNDVRCIPLPFGFSPDSYDQLNVYTELYNTDQWLQEDFYIQYVIAAASTPDGELFTSHKRLAPNVLTPLLHAIDVSKLSTGQYVLKLGAYTQSHELICENEVFFSRSNPDVDAELLENFDTYFANSFTLEMEDDSVDYVLKALAPKVSPTKMDALNYLIRSGELEEKRRFIHRYWLESDPADPEGAYKTYISVANVVDKMFKSGFGYGFETDRGNIFMKYGAPNDVIAVEDEMSAPPYEIWVYYDFPVTAQFNVKFLFYSPELANSYQLLHSTCENEVNNRAWEQILYKNATSETSSGDLIDAQPVSDNFNRRAVEIFADF